MFYIFHNAHRCAIFSMVIIKYSSILSMYNKVATVLAILSIDNKKQNCKYVHIVISDQKL